jgi:hypothetical protein
MVAALLALATWATAALLSVGGLARDAAAQGGPGPGGPRAAARWGADATPGWAQMTRQERDEHRARLQAAKTYEECRRIVDEQHQRMAERAKERGLAVPAQPRRDACAGLPRG